MTDVKHTAGQINDAMIEAYDAWKKVERVRNAAPEMLEALVMIRDADDDCKADGLPTIPPSARAEIDAAIAKAEGKP